MSTKFVGITDKAIVNLESVVSFRSGRCGETNRWRIEINFREDSYVSNIAIDFKSEKEMDDVSKELMEKIRTR